MDEIQGFGESTMKELEELRKALSIGYGDPFGTTGGDALRTESLDRTLKTLTYQAEHIRLWKMIPKSRAASTIEEFNQLLSYGSEAGGFVPGGVMPEIEDTAHRRKSEYVKYVGTTRVVEHPATLINTVPADVIGSETQAGVLWMMAKINVGLYQGNSDAIPLEWNGLVKQIEDGGGHIVDLRGAPITQHNLDDITQMVADDYGMAQDFFCNGRVFTDFSKLYTASQRWPVNIQPGVVGTPVQGYQTNNGLVRFQTDSFVKAGTIPPVAATSPKAPNAPTIAGANTAGAQQFTTGDIFKYKVTAVNSFGESAPTAIFTQAAIANAQFVRLTITDGGGTNPATAYKVYRSVAGAVEVKYLGKITPRSQTNNVYDATTDHDDKNAYLPGMFTGLVLDMSPQSLTFRELLPMVKMDLARIAPSIRWMQLYYGTPIVFNPKKNVVIRNIGMS